MLHLGRGDHGSFEREGSKHQFARGRGDGACPGRPARTKAYLATVFVATKAVWAFDKTSRKCCARVPFEPGCPYAARYTRGGWLVAVGVLPTAGDVRLDPVV